MDDNEVYILFQEFENEVLFELNKSALEESGIRCRYSHSAAGIRYLRRYFQIYVHRDDLENARAALTNDTFADLPWNPDSDNPDPNPVYPWYLDRQKRDKYGKIAGQIVVLAIFILITLIVWTSN